MRRSFLGLYLGTLVLAAAPASAGPVSTGSPLNPCPGAAPLKAFYIANEVGTDAAGPACPTPGSGCAETMVVCHHSGRTGTAPIDVAVELFSSAGVLLPGPLAIACGVAPGASAAFVTLGAPLVPPYFGTIIGVTAPQVPLGSLRVLSTNKTVVCDVTLLDTHSIGFGVSPSPAGAKNVTLTLVNRGQKGD
jgi:hypothetical protein